MKNKKISQIGILVVITIAVLFVLFDFFQDSSEEQAAQDAASQEEVIPEKDTDNTEFGDSNTLEEDTDFDLNEELEEDHVSDDAVFKKSYGANPGDTVYDFELTDMETGEQVKLSDFRGQKVFFNFWASWCPPMSG